MTWVQDGESMAWENELIGYAEEISLSNQRSKEATLYYRGELDRKHGKKEAKELIDSGVLKQVLEYTSVLQMNYILLSS